jgi:hypothetical protein
MPRLAALLALGCVSCSSPDLCPSLNSGLWERQQALPGGCQPGIVDPGSAGCLQLGYRYDGCAFTTQSRCAEGVERVFFADPDTGTGRIVLRDAARGCETSYPIVWRP